MHHPRTKWHAAALAVGVAALAATLGLPASPATAAPCPIGGSFTPETQTIEYGQGWVSTASGLGYFDTAHTYNELKVVSTGTPSGYQPDLYNWVTSEGARSTVSVPYNVPPLGPGSYSFALAAVLTTPNEECDSFSGQTDPAQLTVVPAQLSVELHVVADPSRASGALVTAKFTGRFVDEYQSSFYPGAAKSPEGTWNITLTDSSGEVAAQHSVERPAGDDVLATSFYWPDAEPGEQYTASAQFTRAPASAANFTITQATDFDFTGAEAQRPMPTSTAAALPDTSLPEATGFALPLWLLVVGGLFIAGLGAVVAILSVRLTNRPKTATEQGTA